MERHPTASNRPRPPRRLLAGGVLVAVAWPADWLLPGLRTHLLFFPLWLGYILLVDGIVGWREGTSLATRSPRRFAGLFVISVPGWWLFEVINWRLGSWQYLGRSAFSDLGFFLFGSLCFSTVVPAVLETAELLASCGLFRPLAGWPPVARSRRAPVTLFTAGTLFLGLLLAWPRIFYPLVWLALFFLLDPLAAWLHRSSVLAFLRGGAWDAIAALAGGALVCGFFWELWNLGSYPKWIYHLPGLEHLYLFEMPAVGYLGYLPFGLELYSLTALLMPQPPELRLRASR